MKNYTIYYSTLFGLGFFGYGLIEILWRGRTHPSMSLLGGLCFCVLSLIQQYFKSVKFLYRCVLGGLTITALEFVFGLILNLKLSATVWDYSMFPINFYGQICLIYTVFWCFLSVPFLIISDMIKTKLLKVSKCKTMQILSHDIA